MTFMPSFSTNEVVLVRYPFSDLTGVKVRPAVVVGAPDPSDDIFVVPLTSRTRALGSGEFVLAEWQAAGLNVPSAVKRDIYTGRGDLVLKTVGRLKQRDAREVENALRRWLALFQGRSV